MVSFIQNSSLHVSVHTPDGNFPRGDGFLGTVGPGHQQPGVFIDAIGMGRDRRRVDDSQSEVMALCREHHTVFHTLGLGRFMKMYAVYGIARYRAEAYGAGAEEGR